VEREDLLSLLTLALAGNAVLLAALLPVRALQAGSGRDLERHRFRALLRPLFFGAVVFAVLGGWALLEPDDAERPPELLFAVAIPATLVVARAVARLIWTFTRKHGGTPAFTAGLLRPRAFIEPAFAAQLDPAARDAAIEHERAHVRHRDPLRILAAQFATDLQWPVPAARRRLTAWRQALELARDEDARESGVDGADLAAAIVCAAKVSCATGAAAALTEQELIEDRVGRLLEPLPSRQRDRFGLARVAIWLVALAGACVLGATFGESTVRAVFP
jgi:hypothetical protein